MTASVDYLIIGQGLAGSLLGWELIQRGCKIQIIDDQQENASQIAAGLINPITGMRLVKNENIETLLPSAKKYYHALSDFFKTEFYSEKPLLRIVKNDKELSKFQQRLQDPSYLDFLNTDLQTAPTELIAPHGLIQQKQTGSLSTAPLLNHLKAFFRAQQCYNAAVFDYQDLSLDTSISWRNIQAKHIIFCEGYQATSNPWFKYLPFQLAKGEILTLQSETKLIPQMLNYGRWFIPSSEHEFRIGATFENKLINTHPTQEAKEDLIASLIKIYPSLKSAELKLQQANIRPTTLDKSPFIGAHLQHNNCHIFNGFGSKGSLQIPFYSQHFADHLLNKQPLNKQADISRYA